MKSLWVNITGLKSEFSDVDLPRHRKRKMLSNKQLGGMEMLSDVGEVQVLGKEQMPFAWEY